jgi:hypothetical protein
MKVEMHWERYEKIYIMGGNTGVVPANMQYKVLVCSEPGWVQKMYEVTSKPYETFLEGVSVDMNEFISGRKAWITVVCEAGSQTGEPIGVSLMRGSYKLSEVNK